MAETSLTPIMGQPKATPEQARTLLLQMNANAPDFIPIYQRMGQIYGIAWDLAFAQSIHETAAWKFGGLVMPSQNNFAGLGATGPGNSGAIFSTAEQGIEAQFQHLYGYATTAPLPPGRTVVDPRFDILVRSGLRGVAPFWEKLDGRWAVPGTNYGESIVQLRNRMLTLPRTAPEAPANPPSPTPTPTPTPKPTPTPAVFPDVPSGHRSFTEIQQAAELGIMQGYTDGLFHPDDPVTREQLAIVLSRLIQLLQPPK